MSLAAEKKKTKLADAATETESMRDFLATFAGQLEAKVDSILEPIYRMQDIEDNFGSRKIPYAVQREVVKAIAAAKKAGAKTIFCVGEMGTGKTLMSIWTSRVINAKRSLIIAPPHLIGKWRDEILAAYPGKKVAIIPDQRLRDLGYPTLPICRTSNGNAMWTMLSSRARPSRRTFQ